MLNIFKATYSNHKSRHWLVLIILLFTTLLYMGGISQVPFHPDESTYIFMSSDFQILFTHPADMFWQPSLEGTSLQRYREIDAPITRYLIGAGRALLSYPSLISDWNWSLDWSENLHNGALPDLTLLLISRFSVSFLFFLSLLVIYSIGNTLARPITGLLAALLFASNALVLLHTRRAMAESALTFGVLLAMLGFLKAREKPWLAGIGIAIAFNAKQLALPLLPVGVLAIILLSLCKHDHWKKMAGNLSIYLLLFLVITLALNPIYWMDPFHSVIVSIRTRENLVNQQMMDLLRIAPAQVLDSPFKRIIALIAHVYITPPAIADTGNYLAELQQSTLSYFSNPLNSLFRGVVWGGLFLILTLFGLIILVKKIIFNNDNLKSQYIIFVVAFLAESFFLVATITLPFQRYWIPLVPFTCLLIAIGCTELINTSKILIQR
jgi:4-amino-4-deoxy-L-arabinose transferase-like glycosyltransferase